jgi:hypothetical protein
VRRDHRFAAGCPVVDWFVENATPAADQILQAQAYVPPPIDMGKLGQAFRH